MPKPNFQFEKRRREQMKAKKKEEKRLRKLNKAQVNPDASVPPSEDRVIPVER